MTTTAGIRALRKIQFGTEATNAPGTAVDATAFVVGTLGMKLEQELYMPDDLETGNLASFERSQVIAREATLPFESDATYEQLMYMLNMAVEIPVITAASGNDPTIWTYAPNYTAANSLQTFTVEYGDDVQQWRAEFVSCRQLELSGQVGDVVKVNADLFGRQVMPAAAGSSFTGFTANINPISRETIKMGTAQLYVNDSWGNVGTTEAGATLVDFNWRFMTGLSPMKFADNQLYFTELAQAKRHVELDMTVALNSGTSGWFTRFLEQTLTVMELRFTGTETIAMANDSVKQLKLQTGGKITEFNELTEREGQDIVKVKLVSEYDSTGARDMGVEVRNSVVSLT